MNLYTMAKEIAAEAVAEAVKYSPDSIEDAAREYAWQSCDGHEVAIYYHKAIEFCAAVDTSDGECWLEDAGGIAQPGDTFGQIACRVAFATLHCAVEEMLSEMLEEMEGEKANERIF